MRHLNLASVLSVTALIASTFGVLAADTARPLPLVTALSPVALMAEGHTGWRGKYKPAAPVCHSVSLSFRLWAYGYRLRRGRAR